jgi:hypothetical protein
MLDRSSSHPFISERPRMLRQSTKNTPARSLQRVGPKLISEVRAMFCSEDDTCDDRIRLVFFKHKQAKVLI